MRKNSTQNRNSFDFAGIWHVINIIPNFDILYIISLVWYQNVCNDEQNPKLSLLHLICRHVVNEDNFTLFYLFKTSQQMFYSFFNWLAFSMFGVRFSNYIKCL